jgi:hypothetical protein
LATISKRKISNKECYQERQEPGEASDLYVTDRYLELSHFDDIIYLFHGASLLVVKLCVQPRGLRMEYESHILNCIRDFNNNKDLHYGQERDLQDKSLLNFRPH